jgi:hypothetical protein
VSKLRGFGSGELAIIGITFVLFVLALFLKGFTKELLLEVGIFLVSVKLIMSSYKNAAYSKQILNELDEIKARLGE